MAKETWWGGRELALGQEFRIEIGCLDMYVRRGPREWELSHRRPAQAREEEFACALTQGERRADEEYVKERFVFAQTQPVFEIKPLLADRAMVARPISPVYLPGREGVVFYVSTPLWLGLSVHQEREDLAQLPILRPSDTWFGPNTRLGEFCYAAQTHMRTQLDDLTPSPYKAVTAVSITNTNRQAILIRRLSLPVQYLSLWATRAGQHWSQSVNMEINAGGQGAALGFDPPPPEAGATRQVAQPRGAPGKTMVRSLTSLFA